MEYSQFFFTLFCQVAFCLGLNIIMSEGNLLYFLRKPFEGLYESIEHKVSVYEGLKTWRRQHELIELEHEIFKMKLKYYLTKPLFTCITCFASIWGASVFIALNGINLSLLPCLIITCISSSYIQTAIYAKINI